MENQHQLIKGYRDLTPAEIALMNKIKEHGKATEALIKELRAHVAAQFQTTAGEPQDDGEGDFDLVKSPAQREEWNRLVAAEPHQWINEGRVQFQIALMLLTRAVAQPTSF